MENAGKFKVLHKKDGPAGLPKAACRGMPEAERGTTAQGGTP
jgi:hypothetical protein